MSEHLYDKIAKLEAEIQQLKKELSKETHYKNEWKQQFLKIAKQNIEFAKQVEAAKTLTEKESKTLRQILYNSGIEAKVISWAGNKELILTQKYIPQVFLVEVLSQRKSESAQNSGEKL